MPLNEPAPHLRFGQFELDLRSGELWRGAERVLLPDQPFKLLVILIRERGNLVTRDALRQQLWSGDTFVDFEAGLNAAVKRLRETLGDSAAAPTFIETLPRRGYRFIATVESVVAGHERSAVPVPTHPPVPSPVAHPQGARVRLRRSWRRLALALAVAAVGVAAAAAWAGRHPPGDVTPSASEATMVRLTNLGSVMKASMSPDGQTLAFVRRDGVQESLWVRRGEADPIRLVGPLDGAFESLTFAPGGNVYYTFFSPDRTNMPLYRVAIGGGSPEVVNDASGGISFSPDGTQYAFVSNLSLVLRESHVVVVRSAGKRSRVLTIRTTPESFVMLKPAWSPDGTHLAVFGASDVMPERHQIVGVDVRDGTTRRIAEVPLAQVDGAVWLTGGRELIVSGRERRASPQRLWSVAIESGSIRQLTSDVSDYSLVGVSADGSQVLAVRRESTRSLWIADAAGPDRSMRIAADAGSLHGFDEIAWAPDGQLLYTLAESGNADVWSVDPATNRRQRLTTDAGDDYHPAVSPDGRTVVFGSSREGRPGLWSMSRDGTSLKRLTTGGDSRPSFSADGTWVAFQRSGVETTPWMVLRVFLTTGAVQQVTSPPTMRPSVSPDGRFVAHYWMTPERWMLAVTPATGGVPTAMFAVEPTQYKRVVRWSPDGKALAFIDGAGGASNIWLQPLDNGPRRQVTYLSDGAMETFDWSRDGSKIAWMRVEEVRDLVAIALNRDGR